MHTKTAVLILEAPWDIYEGDINRSSVEPFFQGLAKQTNDVDILHSRFYDASSFRSAFKVLSSCRYKNAIVYVAGHGDGQRVSGAKIVDIMAECNLSSVAANITGVVLGSCFSAGTVKRPQAGIIDNLVQASNIAWVAAYNCAAFWHESTIVDLSIIRHMLGADEDDFSTREGISELLARGIECFSPHFALGDDGKGDDQSQRVSLRDGITFFSQPRGQGNRSRSVTAEVWAEWQTLQLAEDVNERE
ncbi:hypothetical protein SJI00_16390 [Pseudomonas sp. RP23018S]|uniref:hypothetical protein n=1 Tax=Pseudomonas sp. RP23018S TaxID=3096037 RepID=UPI002ACA1DD2|nr:hypothetical protein [Pseudomonas sp. RP23018S]MDZ5604353.1 hypothetical protein [Pseudomonas sp. RP23018S]